MKKLKQSLSILLVLTMLLGLLPVMAVSAATVVDTIAVSNIKQPVAGERPSYTASLSGSGYTLSGANAGNWKVNGIVWLCDGDAVTGSIVSGTETFRPGHTYTVLIELVAEDGYSFLFEHNKGNYAAVTINGKAASLHIDNCSTQQYQVCYTFTCPQQEITTVMLYNLDEPVGGQTPDTKITAAYPEYYVVESVTWSDIEGGAVNGTFETGVPYQVEIVVASAKLNGDDLSCFADTAGMTVYIDGTQLSYLDRVTVQDNKVTILYQFRNPAPAPGAGAYAFTVQPLGGAVGVWESHTAYWQTNFIPTYYNIEYWDGTAWDQWDVINDPEVNEGDHDFIYDTAGSFRFRIVAYIGNDAVAYSDEFTVAWGNATHTVKFSANGGSGIMAPVTAEDGIYVIPECTFTPPAGKEYKSWKIGEEEWWPGEKYPLTKDITLTAQWKTKSAKTQVNHMEITSADLDSIPVLYGKMFIPDFTITEGAPAYITASAANLRWQKKVDDNWENQYSGLFTPGEWRISTQVRVDRDSAKTHEIGKDFTLTVNGKNWITEKPMVYPEYSMVWVYSPTYVIVDDPNIQPPQPVESVNIRLAGYNVGAKATDVKAVSDAPVNVTVSGFLDIGDGSLQNPDSIKEVTGAFEADKNYAVAVTFTPKSGYDISGLLAEDITLEQSAMDMMEIYSDSDDVYQCMYLLSVPAAPVAPAVTITTQPKTTYAKEGAKLSVKVTAKGDGLKYQWYIKNAGSSKYSKSSVTSATYSVTMGDKVKDRRVYCVVTDKYGNTVQSNTVLLRRQVTVTKESATIKYAQKGAKAAVKVTAVGDGLKYTWYVKNDGASKYSKSSVTSATYSVTMAAKVKNRRVYCVVTDRYGKKVQSKTFTLRESASITTQPKTVTVKKNATAKVTVKAGGDGLKYTWYVKNEGAGKYSKSSVTKSTYSVKMTAKVKNRLVYCVVTDKYGNTVKSKTVRLKMK